MISRDELLDRIAAIQEELALLRRYVEEERDIDRDATTLFLQKCKGYRDELSTKEVIKEVYDARINSERNVDLEGPSL